jgi:hypothetical protein
MGTMQRADLLLMTDAELPGFFLGRLTTLASRHAAAVHPKVRLILAQAAFSIYLDCLDLGLGAEAHAIIERAGDEARAA